MFRGSAREYYVNSVIFEAVHIIDLIALGFDFFDVDFMSC